MEKNPNDFEKIKNRIAAIFKNYGLNAKTLIEDVQ
jgi:hypothetical protein